MMDQTQEYLDRFYHQNGPCCAGCDHWRAFNSLVGECRATAPVLARERGELIHITSSSRQLSAGHVLTRREHHCGEFKDEFDWSSLPLAYQKRVGASKTEGGE